MSLVNLNKLLIIKYRQGKEWSFLEDLAFCRVWTVPMASLFEQCHTSFDRKEANLTRNYRFFNKITKVFLLVLIKAIIYCIDHRNFVPHGWRPAWPHETMPILVAVHEQWSCGLVCTKSGRIFKTTMIEYVNIMQVPIKYIDSCARMQIIS